MKKRILSAFMAMVLVVFDDGKVINVGTHSYLLENEPMYVDIVHLQELEAMLVKEGE